MILVDTSAWIEFLRRTGSVTNDRVRYGIQTGDDFAVLDVVRMELLAGASSDAEAASLRRFLARFTPVLASSPADHELAAVLYRLARRSGETVRSLVDCLVVAAALRLGAPVLARDRDYQVLASVSELQVL